MTGKFQIRELATELSAHTLRCIESVLIKHNMGVIEAAKECAESERQNALNEVLAELSSMYEKADKGTPMHKGMRMALSSASDKVKALMHKSTLPKAGGNL